jgi:hypothetical protein
MRQNQLNAFEAWIGEGNAQVIDNAWSTQDSMWTNRIESKGQLWAYYLREFFGVTPAQYVFTEVLPYMDVVSEREYVLKYNNASSWIVDLFMTLRSAEFGQFASWEGLTFTSGGAEFRMEKENGRFGRYGRLHITLTAFDCAGDFLAN